MHFGRPNLFFFWGRGVGFEILLRVLVFSQCSQQCPQCFPHVPMCSLICSQYYHILKNILKMSFKCPKGKARTLCLGKTRGTIKKAKARSKQRKKKLRVKLENAPIPKFHPSRFLCIDVWQ